MCESNISTHPFFITSYQEYWSSPVISLSLSSFSSLPYPVISFHSVKFLFKDHLCYEAFMIPLS